MKIGFLKNLVPGVNDSKDFGVVVVRMKLPLSLS